MHFTKLVNPITSYVVDKITTQNKVIDIKA